MSKSTAVWNDPSFDLVSVQAVVAKQNGVIVGVIALMPSSEEGMTRLVTCAPVANDARTLVPNALAAAMVEEPA